MLRRKFYILLKMMLLRSGIYFSYRNNIMHTVERKNSNLSHWGNKVSRELTVFSHKWMNKYCYMIKTLIVSIFCHM